MTCTARFRRLLSGWLPAAVLCVTGCVHLEQGIELRKDGSATFTYRYSVATDVYELVETGQHVLENWQGRSAVDDPMLLNWFFSEARAREHFSGPGLRIETCRTFDEGGRRQFELVATAADARHALGSGKFGLFTLRRERSGAFRFAADMVSSDDVRDVNPEELARLQQLCDDMKLVLKLTVPTKLLDSTATRASKREASWVFEPARDGAFLARPPTISATFSGRSLGWD